MVRVEEGTFEPGIFSNEELAFLLDHIKETPTAALHKGVPVGVNPVAVQNLLTILQTYDQLQKVHGVAWAGFDAVTDSMMRYLAWSERSEEIHRRTGGARSPKSIRFPSQYAWDASGNAFKGGIDADSGELVRTEILDDGSRKPFGVRLIEPEGRVIPALEEVAPWIRLSGGVRKSPDDKVVEAIIGRNGTMTCSVCGKAEQFDTKTRSTYMMARTRMGKHLKSARSEVARHRLLYRKTYESPTHRAS